MSLLLSSLGYILIFLFLIIVVILITPINFDICNEKVTIKVFFGSIKVKYEKELQFFIFNKKINSKSKNKTTDTKEENKKDKKIKTKKNKSQKKKKKNNKKRNIIDDLLDIDFIEIIEILFKFIFKLFKCFHLKINNVDIQFGIKNYSKMCTIGGYGCAILSTLNIPYDLQYNFNEKIFKCNVILKGKIIIGQILIVILSFVFKKPVFKLVRKFGGI